MELVEQAMPPPTDADLDRWLRTAMARCAEVGLVGVHDAGVDGPLLRSLLRLQANGELPIRVYAMEREADTEIQELLSVGPRIASSAERVTLRTVKFFLDGALGSRGAAFFEPYADAPGQSGLLLETEAELVDKLTRRMRAGFQVALHAIGDRANALAISALGEAQKQVGRFDLRPRIEHAQHVRLVDLPAFAASGAIASMQPTHHRSDWSWARARLGPARWKGAYAWRSMLAAGIPLAFGSDSPIEDPAPLLGLLAATARTTADEPDERLSFDEALRAFTQGAAYAAFEERQSGMLQEGYRCDLTLLDRDPRSIPPAELTSLRVVGTVVGGRAHLR
jgi:predicted amidohydrolase YtcJ